jgi:hypothetical protein
MFRSVLFAHRRRIRRGGGGCVNLCTISEGYLCDDSHFYLGQWGRSEVLQVVRSEVLTVVALKIVVSREKQAKLSGDNIQKWNVPWLSLIHLRL